MWPTHRHMIKNKNNNNKYLKESFIAFEAGIRFQFYTDKNTRILVILIPMNLILSALKPKQITDNINEPWKYLHPSTLNPWMFKLLWPGELRSRWNSAATHLPLRCGWSQMSLLVVGWEPGRIQGLWRSWLEDAASMGGAVINSPGLWAASRSLEKASWALPTLQNGMWPFWCFAFRVMGYVLDFWPLGLQN